MLKIRENATNFARNLQALGVVVVELGAGGAGNARSGAGPSNATALLPLGDAAANGSSWGRSSGSGDAGRGDGSDGSGPGADNSGGARLSRVGGSSRVGGVEVTEADVGEGDLGVGGVGNEVLGMTTVGGARATRNTGNGVGLVKRPVGVEPEHADGEIGPDGHNEDHTVGHLVTHPLHGTLVLVIVDVTKDSLSLAAELISDGIDWVNSRNLDSWVLVDPATLDPLAADLNKVTIVSAIMSDELSDDGELLVGVEGETGARTIEVPVAHAPWVDVASVLVADTVVTLVRGVVTARRALATVEAVSRASVGSVGVGVVVGLPDIHLGAASSVLARAGILVLGRWLPSLGVGLSSLVNISKD